MLTVWSLLWKAITLDGVQQSPRSRSYDRNCDNMASNPQQGMSKPRENEHAKNKKNYPPRQQQHQQQKQNQNQNQNPRIKKNNKPNTNESFVMVNPTPGPSKQPVDTPMNNPVVKHQHKMLNDVLNILECPVCLEFIKAPIFMCENGHDICGQCRARLCLPICPLCKTTITNQRNFKLEEIAAKMMTPCTNASYGCTYVGSPDDIKQHFENCLFRQYFCPMGREFKQCFWNGTLSQMQMHFATDHENNVKLKPSRQVLFDNFDVNKKDEDIQLIGIGKSLYLYHVKIDPAKKLAFWGVQYVGGAAKSDLKGTYEINIYNSKKPKKSICITEDCQPNNLSFQDIYDSGNCAAIPLNVLKNFIHDNKKFTFKFFIRPGESQKSAPPPKAKPEEKKDENKDLAFIAKKLNLMN